MRTPDLRPCETAGCSSVLDRDRGSYCIRCQGGGVEKVDRHPTRTRPLRAKNIVCGFDSVSGGESHV